MIVSRLGRTQLSLAVRRSFALSDDCPRRGAKLVPQPGGLRFVLPVSDDLSREIEETRANTSELRRNSQSCRAPLGRRLDCAEPPDLRHDALELGGGALDGSRRSPVINLAQDFTSSPFGPCSIVSVRPSIRSAI